jgi:hypothetical protein
MSARCEHCGLFSLMWLPDTFPQGGTVECIGCAHLIQAYDLDVGSPGLEIQWKSRSLGFKLQQFRNLLRVWIAARITTLDVLRGLWSPATTIWFFDKIGDGIVCVCPEVLTEIPVEARA